MVEAKEVGKVSSNVDLTYQGATHGVVPHERWQEGRLFPHQGDNIVSLRPSACKVALQKVHLTAWEALAVWDRGVEVDRCEDLSALGCQLVDVVLERVRGVRWVSAYDNVGTGDASGGRGGGVGGQGTRRRQGVEG